MYRKHELSLMKSVSLTKLFVLVLILGGYTSHGQNSQLPDEVKLVMSEVTSWDIENREAVLASLGETNRLHRGDWKYDSTLPFGSELAAFDAISLPTGIELTWVTTTEFGSEVFAVERKLEDGKFATITLLEAEGISNRLNVYRYLDHRTDGIPQTYRLRQTDQNGTVHLSQTVDIFPFVDRLAVFSPEILDDAIQLPLESRIVKVTVWNSAGKRIFSVESWEEGIQEIDTSDWKAGKYAIQMETESGRRSALIALP